MSIISKLLKKQTGATATAPVSNESNLEKPKPVVICRYLHRKDRDGMPQMRVYTVNSTVEPDFRHVSFTAWLLRIQFENMLIRSREHYANIKSALQYELAGKSTEVLMSLQDKDYEVLAFMIRKQAGTRKYHVGAVVLEIEGNYLCVDFCFGQLYPDGYAEENPGVKIYGRERVEEYLKVKDYICYNKTGNVPTDFHTERLERLFY